MYKYNKRFIDLIFSFIFLIIFFPFLIIVAIAIKLESKGNIFFLQKRIGYKGKEFNIIKFRSMVKNAETQGTGVFSYKGDARVTKVGRFIRATSIDELPQLFNILRGDMAIIGPRPPLTYHPWPYNQYTDEQKRMFDVRPGLTGWAQVNGRKEVPWPERIHLNVQYVDNISFLFDLKIFFLTIFKVLTMMDNNNIENTN